MDIEKTLLPEEDVLLAECEAILARDLQTFWNVGSALDTVRIGKLYRATHLSFVEYCRARWNMGKAEVKKQSKTDD